jgi:glycosyltransferase involved in cell wall biosynthesis
MAYLNSSAVRERVRLTGHLADEELRALYSACRVFVYPSLYEGFGLPLLEAMSCGAAVVTSRVPSIIETVGDVARLVSATDVDELARAITALLTDAKEREHRSTAGLEHAKKFSWERTAAATLEVYKNVSHKKVQKSG